MKKNKKIFSNYLIGSVFLSIGVSPFLAYAQTPTLYDNGSVAVYSLRDAAPVSIGNLPATKPSIEVFPLSGSLPTEAPILPPQTRTLPLPIPRVAVNSIPNKTMPVIDTSYASDSLIIAGSSMAINENINVAPLPSNTPKIGPAETMLRQVKETLPPVKASSDDMTGGAVAPQAINKAVNVSAPPPVIADVPQKTEKSIDNEVAPKPSAPVVPPEPSFKAATPALSAGVNSDNCAINQNLVEKMALLEKEKEALRALGVNKIVNPELQNLAQCASEKSKIMALETEIEYLREENASLKRISNEHMSEPSPSGGADKNTADVEAVK